MRQKVKKHLPYAYTLFMMVAEPRAIRIMQFGIYVCMGIAGAGIITSPSVRFQEVLNEALVYMFGGFLTFGSLLGVVSVLPGIWWLERAGIISIIFGMIIYVVILADTGATFMGFTVVCLFSLTFAQRWLEIRRFQLAPKEPIEVKEV